MSRTIECPRCGIRVQSKFMTDPNKVPRHVGVMSAGSDSARSAVSG